MNSRFEKNWRVGLWSLLAAGLALGTYLGVAAILGQVGYPLDDAWIHQTYARSLALRGEWAYWPGEVSAGSTSPLWTILLIPGQWIPNGMFFWTFVLGWLGLAGSAWLAQLAYQHIIQPEGMKLPIMALLLAFEWHLVWAAGSGMETILYVLVILAVFAELTRKDPRYWLAGGLAGLAGWVRPDGLTLFGPVLFVAVLTTGTRQERVIRVGQSLAGLLALLLPNLMFNYFMAGSVWPNTFYAKQAEYAIMTREAFIIRLLRMMMQPMVGIGILLLPGVVWGFSRGLKRQNWVLVAIGLFWLGNTVLFAWRLPVTFQHARYLIPAMAAYFLLGFSGMVELLKMFIESKQIRLFRFGWKLALTLTLLLFYLIGAISFTNDVGIINTEMVAAAKWVSQNTEPDAIVAAHDIGALGYYGDRRLVDLAGLISPDVVPFIRDEEQLANYLDKKGAGYLVTFPGWYNQLDSGKKVLWQSTGNYAIEQGGKNMVVFEWKN
jgi:arabinofuranosyltransferase